MAERSLWDFCRLVFDEIQDINTSLSAVKTTADSAVKSVTTGTSNGTIAVDGTNVSVKGLGSAAYKTAGTASGNVPTNGAALGTTANVPVVTNTSGALIPHSSGALGTAAFKTAGSASGNIPLNGSALGTTANVPVVTNTSGALIPHASGALGTAAFKASTAFDSAGAASTVQTNLDSYKTSNDSALAAVKTTADSAVQSIATGSTNGTITVDGTDVSVKGLGSAAYKTAGSASGNVPVNGSALGTTANVPVVTNTSGNLIPHASGALGTAAFKASTAFDAAGAASTVQTNLDAYKTSNDNAVAALDTRISALENAMASLTNAEEVSF